MVTVNRTLSAAELGFSDSDALVRARLENADERRKMIERIDCDARLAYRTGQSGLRMTYICLRGPDDEAYFRNELRRRFPTMRVTTSPVFSAGTLVIDLSFYKD